MEREKYAPVLKFLFENPRYVKLLATIASPMDYENLAGMVIQSAIPSGQALKLLKQITEFEFEHHTLDFNEVLRGNSVAARMHTAFVKSLGSDFFRIVLKEDITSILSLKDFNCEVDPKRLAGVQNIIKVVNQNQQDLRNATSLIFERLAAEESVNSLPREIRCITHLVNDYSVKYGADRLPVVGGSLFLRYINPVVCTPDAHGLVPANVRITQRQRRNLVLITKVLQALANSVEFGSKEEYMTCMNDFISEKQEMMNEMLDFSQVDNLEKDKNLAFYDLLEAKGSPDVANVPEKYLMLLHRFLSQYAPKMELFFKMGPEDAPLVEGQVPENYGLHPRSHMCIFTKETIDIEMDKKLLKIIEELGPPPTVEVRNLSLPPPIKKTMRPRRQKKKTCNII